MDYQPHKLPVHTNGMLTSEWQKCVVANALYEEGFKPRDMLTELGFKNGEYYLTQYRKHTK